MAKLRLRSLLLEMDFLIEDIFGTEELIGWFPITMPIRGVQRIVMEDSYEEKVREVVVLWVISSRETMFNMLFSHTIYRFMQYLYHCHH